MGLTAFINTFETKSNNNTFLVWRGNIKMVHQNWSNRARKSSFSSQKRIWSLKDLCKFYNQNNIEIGNKQLKQILLRSWSKRVAFKFNYCNNYFLTLLIEFSRRLG